MAFDVLVVTAMLTLVVVIGFTGYRKSRKPIERFVAGRQVHWLPLGTSLAASSTSADTPLLIAGAVYADGLAGNWFWWASAPGVLATLFFFARLWRRSGVLTDVGIIRLRYGDDTAATTLRIMRAIMEGLVLNVLVLASNGYALALVLEAMAGRWNMGSAVHLSLVMMAIGFGATTAFVLIIGFRGLVRSGTTEFVLTVIAGIGLAGAAIAGLPGGFQRLQLLVSARGQAPVLSLMPVDGAIGPLILMAVGWWHTAPGRGLLVQRLAAARNERAAFLTIASFSVFHFIVRPWSWYVIGLAALVYLPGRINAETALPRLAASILPTGFYGVLVAMTALAFTGCVTSRLNLGASYMVNDVARLLMPSLGERAVRRVEWVSAVFLATAAVLLVVTGSLGSMRTLYQFITVMLAGTGFVAIARWYWWRTSLACEIASLATAGIGAASALMLLDLSRPTDFVLATALNFICGALVTILIAFIGTPTSEPLLRRFYEVTAPGGRGWRPFADGRGRGMSRLAARWLFANIALFATIAGCSCLMGMRGVEAGLLLVLALLCLGGVHQLRDREPAAA